MNENDKQAAQGKDILSPPHPRHFGIPVEHWEAAKNYAEYLTQNEQAEPVAWILFRRDEDGLEPIRFYGSDEKPDGEFKDRFVLYQVHFEGTSLIVTAPAQPVQPALAHVNETPKNEHDSDHVLNKSGDVNMMREALRKVRDRFFPADQPERDRDILWDEINQALAAEPAPLVRLTDDEIECARLEWCKTGWEVTEFSHAIMDAMIAKNGG